MRVGVIGTGVMGRNHVRMYSEFKGIEDLYVFDTNPENANKMKEYGAKVCASVEDLLGKVDAVSVCVPTKYHFDAVKKAIEKGVHCLIEKPIASSAMEGEEILRLLKNKKMVAGVGHIERFNPIIDEIKKIIEKPHYIEIKRHNPASSRITDSSVVEDLMIHDIDVLFNMLLIPNGYKIYGAGNSEMCKAVISAEGLVASMSASRMASKKIRTIYIEDKKFTIEGDFMTQEIYVYWKPEKYAAENGRYAQENIIEKVLVNKVEPLRVELKTFIECVKNGTPFPVTPGQAVKNLKVCGEIKKCL